MKFQFINEWIAKKGDYPDDAWSGMPAHRRSLEITEAILRDLAVSKLMPLHYPKSVNFAHWLLHESPLTEIERAHVRRLLFDIDYY